MNNNFILLDSAKTAKIMENAKKLNPTHQSLYTGSAGENLADVPHT